MKSVWNVPELLAALTVIALGTAAIVVAQAYPLGSLLRMGPGYVPVALGVLLVLCGLALAMHSRGRVRREPVDPGLRAFVCIMGGVLLWTVLLDRVGFVAASVVLITCCAAAERGSRPLGVLALAVGLCGFGYVVFIRWLGIPLTPFGG